MVLTWTTFGQSVKNFGLKKHGGKKRGCVGPVVADSQILILGSSLLFEVQFKLIWRKVVQALMNPF